MRHLMESASLCYKAVPHSMPPFLRIVLRCTHCRHAPLVTLLPQLEQDADHFRSSVFRDEVIDYQQRHRDVLAQPLRIGIDTIPAENGQLVSFCSNGYESSFSATALFSQCTTLVISRNPLLFFRGTGFSCCQSCYDLLVFNQASQEAYTGSL